MKSFKLLAALLSVGAIAAKDTAQVATVTVASPVSTRTHTNIVYVTESAGASVNNCSASLCTTDNATTNGLATIRFTSYTTSTTTQVIIPPDATTTITSALTGDSLSSCTKQPPSTITVTITETSLPVITRSVYPIPASSFADQTMTQYPPYQNESTPPTSTSISASPPYANTSVTYTMTYTSTYTLLSGSSIPTGYMPLISNIHGVPEIPAPMTTTQTNSSYTGAAMNSSATTSSGMYYSSGAGSVRPPRFLSLLAKILSLGSVVKAQSSSVLITEGNEPEALSDACLLQGYTSAGCPIIEGVSQDIVPRFYPYPAPLNSGLPPHMTKKGRTISDDNVTTTFIPGTVFVTNTVVATFTQPAVIASPVASSPTGSESPLSVATPLLVVPPTTASPAATSSMTSSSTTTMNNITSPLAAPPSGSSNVTSSVADAQPNNASAERVTVSVTVTQLPSPTLVSVLTTATSISHVTEIDQTHVTSTFIMTVSQTFASFTGDIAPSATGVAAGLSSSIGCVVIAMGVALLVRF